MKREKGAEIWLRTEMNDGDASFSFRLTYGETRGAGRALVLADPTLPPVRRNHVRQLHRECGEP